MAPSELLLAMFGAAIDAALPSRCLPPFLPPRPRGRTIVVGAGKAAASMARVVEAAWDGPLQGLVVTRHGHGVPCERITVVEASHPVPDAAGAQAAAQILQMVQGLGPDDLVLALISGGGSALLTLPAPGLTLDMKREVNRALLKSGATIGEMNCVRKHLSSIKGGRLAVAASPAPLVALLISDVPGDDPATIASGPTVPDPTTREEAGAILKRYAIPLPDEVWAHLDSEASETPKPGHPAFASVETRLCASPLLSLRAAAAVAEADGVTPLILGDALEGEAREVGRMQAGMARACAEHAVPARPPCVLISGGETTVTVRGTGRGGRNAEFLLGFAAALPDDLPIHALAADTDGIDGSEDNAGALVTPDTRHRARAAGIDLEVSLAANDAFSVFEALDDLVTTGPTLTNVNDFRAILVTQGKP